MTQLRSHSRLVRKLQDALGDQLCVALDDATVVEIMLNPDGKLFIERLAMAWPLQVCSARPRQK